MHRTFWKAALSCGLLVAALGCAGSQRPTSRSVDAGEAARLVGALQSFDPAIWVPASLQFEKLEGRAATAVPALCLLFGDEELSLEVRSRAGIALMHQGAPAIAPLSRLLRRVSPEVPPAAARALGELGDTAAAVPLVDFLREPRGVMEAARERERQRLSDEKVLLLITLLSLYGVPPQEIQKISDGVDRGVENEVARAAASARAIAVQAIGYLKEPSTSKRLAVLVADGDAAGAARAAAAAALGALREHQAVPLLLGSLADADPVVRAGAASALGDIGDLRAVAALEIAVVDTDPGVRQKAAGALGKIANPRTLKALVTAALAERDRPWPLTRSLQDTGRLFPLHLLLDALHGSDVRRRKAAAYVLAQIQFGDKTALLAEELSKVFADPVVRKRAAELANTYPLGRSDSQVLEALGSSDDKRRLALVTSVLKNGLVSERQALLELAAGGRWTPPEEVLSELQSPDRERQLAGALKVGLLGEAAEPATGRLIELLAVRYAVRTPLGGALGMQETAAAALAQIGPAATAPLIAALADREKAQYAASALGDLKDPAAVEPLIDLMVKAEAATAEKAAAALGRIRIPRTADVLMKIVRERSASIRARRCAAEALGWHGDPRAVEPLIDALTRDVAEVRMAAATALGLLRDLRAVDPLVRAMAADSHDLRRRIAEALGRIRGSRALAALSAAAGTEPLPYVRAGIVDALFQAAWSQGRSTPIGPFLEGLSDGDGMVRDTAAGKLALIPDERKVEILIALLSQPRVDLYAARALSHSRDPRALAPLIAALSAPNPLLRRAAAETLGEMRSPLAVEPLIGLLAGADRQLAAAAAKALGKTRDRRAEAPLMAALEQVGLEVGLEFPAALLEINRAPGVEFYVAALRVRSFQEKSIESLALIGEPAVSLVKSALAEADPVKRAGAARALGRIGSAKETEDLIKALADPDGVVRAGAMEGLARIGDERATRALGDALRQDDPEARRHAALALRTAGAQSDPELVRKSLMDSDPLVREQAVRYFGERGDIEVLVPALDDESEKVRDMANWKLRSIGVPAVDPLIVALEQGSPRARAMAARSLAEIRDPRAVAALTAALEDPAADVRVHAVYALKVIGDPRPVERLIAKLTDESPEVRFEAVYAAVTFKDPRAFVPLLAALEDPDGTVATAAASSIGVFRDLRAVEPLIQKLDHGNWKVREGAVATLGGLGDGRAVGPLVALLQKRNAREMPGIEHALTRITGEDFGISVERWLSWWEEKGKKAYPARRKPPRSILVNPRSDMDEASLSAPLR